MSNSPVVLNMAQPQPVDYQSMNLNNRINLNLGGTPQNLNTLNTQPLSLNVNPQPLSLNLNSQNINPQPLSLNLNTQPLSLNVNPSNLTGVGTTTTDDYDRMELRQHIYDVPDSYIGSIDKIPRLDRLLNLSNPKNPMFKLSSVYLPSGVGHLLGELLTNSNDCAQLSREDGIDPGIIEIYADRKTIRVRNGGKSIGLGVHQKELVHLPEMIFGILLTSSNYGKNKGSEKKVGGRNGYGAKLVNIFSTRFVVRVGNPIQGYEYEQVWYDNMRVRKDPILIPNYTGESYVEVEYDLDFKHLDYENFTDDNFSYTEYSNEAYQIFGRYVADLAFTSKVPIKYTYPSDVISTPEGGLVTLLGEPVLNRPTSATRTISFNIKNVFEYSHFFTDDLINYIIYYEWPKGTETVNRKMGGQTIKIAKNSAIAPDVEMMLLDTPDNGQIIPFANGIWSINGGVHSNKAYNVFGNSIIKIVNDSQLSKKEKANGKAPTHKLNITALKRHATILMSCRLVNPKWKSQEKEHLTTPTPIIKPDPKLIKQVEKWELVLRLYADIKAKKYKSMKGKTNNRGKRGLGIEKYQGANNIRPKDKDIWNENTLYLTEGGSAAGYVKKMISEMVDGRDANGIYPMRGKSLNVMGREITRILENPEIKDLYEILNLQDGLDYTDPENYAMLPYGRIVIVADSDVDGKHIVGLILNIFHCLHPTLLKRGYLMFMRTPIIRVWKGAQKMKFFVDSDYEKWKEATSNWRTWEHKYFKGLGSSNDDDVKDDYSDPKEIYCLYDDESPKYFRLAFHKKATNQRKDWILKFDPTFNIVGIKMLPISQFIYYEFIEHPVDNVARSIPLFLDGLKKVQRKIVWAGKQNWGAKIGTPKAKSMKLCDYSSLTSRTLSYHHGPASLDGAISLMNLDYIGSNNMRYFYPDGQFGTRDADGNDGAASRYPSTKPEWWWPYVYKKEDDQFLVFTEDEGIKCEPKTLLPIIPMGAINGAKAISTGYATYMPNHDPRDIINWLKIRINNDSKKEKGEEEDPLPYPIPWYKGFDEKGTINLREIISHTKRESDAFFQNVQCRSNDANDDNEDEYDMDDDENVSSANPFGDSPDNDVIDLDTSDRELRLSMITEGRFKVETHGKTKTKDGKTKILIDELPIGVSQSSYKKWLEKQMMDKKDKDGKPKKPLLTDYDNKSKHDTVKFILYGVERPSILKLKLRRTYGMTNMVFLDSNGKPMRFDNIQDYMEAWYTLRLPYYLIRKSSMISTIEEKIREKHNKSLLIRAVLDGFDQGAIPGKTVIIQRKKRSEVFTQMDLMNISHDAYTKARLSNLDEEDIIKLQEDIRKLEEEKNRIIHIEPGQLWLIDLEEFEKIYMRKYKMKPKEPIYYTGFLEVKKQKIVKPKKQIELKVSLGVAPTFTKTATGFTLNTPIVQLNTTPPSDDKPLTATNLVLNTTPLQIPVNTSHQVQTTTQLNNDDVT